MQEQDKEAVPCDIKWALKQGLKYRSILVNQLWTVPVLVWTKLDRTELLTTGAVEEEEEEEGA